MSEPLSIKCGPKVVGESRNDIYCIRDDGTDDLSLAGHREKEQSAEKHENSWQARIIEANGA